MVDTQKMKPTFFQRAAAAVRYTITGANSGWMPPMDPLPPLVGDVAEAQVKGRAWDYPVAWNLNYLPRANEPLPFSKLKTLAEWCPLVRTVIETRKDQVEALEWQIMPREAQRGQRPGTNEHKGKIKEIMDFLKSPDKELDFSQWIREILEQHFVLDAPAIYRNRTRGGKLYALQLIDGGTIKVLLNSYGRTPLPPDPAYQQVLKGLPAVNYSSGTFNPKDGPTFKTGELIYYPKNKRVDRAYGYPPVAQIVDYIEMAIGRLRFQKAWFTEGNVPDSFIEAPENMTSEQIATMQVAMDNLFAGNIEQRRKVWWLPHNSKYTPIKGDPLADSFDEWLARVICYAFSISPQPFVKMMNRATAASAQETAAAEGLEPTMLWLKRLMDRIIAEDFDAPYLEFEFQTDKEYDPGQAAVSENLFVRAGIKSIDEVRDNLGLDPMGGAASELLVYTAQGYQPVDPEEAADLKAQYAPPAVVPGAAAKPGGPQSPKKPKAKQGPPQKGGDDTKKGDELESSIYVYRPVLNEHDLQAWAAKSGFSLMPAPHVMLAASDLPVIWSQIPRDPAPSYIVDEGPRAVGKNASGSLVLSFVSPDLAGRWGELLGYGLSWPTELDEHKNHIVLTLDGGDIDLPTLQPYDGPLLFGEEEFASIPGNVFDQVVSIDKLTRDDVHREAANADPNPSPAQAEAGNYRKGHIQWQGLDISVETAMGEKRKGIGRDGKPWSCIMPTAYGYVKRTVGADGDHVDVYLGDNPESGKVWVLDQVDHQTKKFDEHKVGIMYNTLADYLADYHLAHGDGMSSERIHGVTEMTVDQLKSWLEYGDLTKPLSKTVTVGTGLTYHDDGTVPDKELHEEPIPEGTRRKEVGKHSHSPFRGRATKARKTPKGYRALTPVPLRSPTTRKATLDARQIMTKGLRHVQKSVVRQVRAKLQHLGKISSSDPVVEGNPFGHEAHGHIYAHTVGHKVRCGGPQRCGQCQKEWLHRFRAAYPEFGKLTKAEEEDEAERLAKEIADALDLGDLQVVVDDMEQLLDQVGEEAGKLALAQVGVTDSDLVNQIDERAASWAEDRAAELVGMHYDAKGNLVPSADAEMRIDDSTRDMVQTIISDGLSDGLTSDEIADELASMDGRPFSDERAQLIADTEIARAHSQGALMGYKEAQDAGVNTLKEWSVADTPCEVCEGNGDDGPIQLDELFSSGDDTPPGHPNCECVLLPYVQDEEDQ